MSSGGLDAANLLLIYPLLDRGKADPQLQGRVAELQQSLIIPFGFAVLLHRDAIVTIMKYAVNSVAAA
jgi:hypothetical protein